MKKELILIILLIAVAIFSEAQTTLPKISDLSATSGTLAKCDTCKFNFSYAPNTFTIREPTSRLLIVSSSPAQVMTVTYPDSAGVVKVWFDKRKIVWTSDSTFTLRTK